MVFSSGWQGDSSSDQRVGRGDHGLCSTGFLQNVVLHSVLSQLYLQTGYVLLAVSDLAGDVWIDDIGIVEEKCERHQVGRVVWQRDVSDDGLQQYACVGTVVF